MSRECIIYVSLWPTEEISLTASAAPTLWKESGSPTLELLRNTLGEHVTPCAIMSLTLLLGLLVLAVVPQLSQLYLRFSCLPFYSAPNSN
jgi:hypothetical protein